jgi:hypothetical protein
MLIACAFVSSYLFIRMVLEDLNFPKKTNLEVLGQWVHDILVSEQLFLGLLVWVCCILVLENKCVVEQSSGELGMLQFTSPTKVPL